MKSKRFSLPIHQPSIFSQQSFNDNRLHATESYEIEQQMQMMISANQIIEQIVHKRNHEIDELLSINLTIVQQIMKSRLLRTLKGQKMMMLVICELVILIKENTLAIKKPQRQMLLRDNFRMQQNVEMRNESNINLDNILEQIDLIRSNLNSQDRHRIQNVVRVVDRVQRKLSSLFNTKSKFQIIRLENQKLLSQERAIRELLEQQIQDYEKQVQQLKQRQDFGVNQRTNQLEKLREEVIALRMREEQLISELRAKEDEDREDILNSDILPMLLIQGISLETVLESK